MKILLWLAGGFVYVLFMAYLFGLRKGWQVFKLRQGIAQHLKHYPAFSHSRVLVGADGLGLLALDDSSDSLLILERRAISKAEYDEQQRQAEAQKVKPLLGFARQRSAEAELIPWWTPLLGPEPPILFSVPYASEWKRSDLLSVQIHEDGETTTRTDRSSQLGGALLGGLAFGEAGAFVGALSGSKTTTGTVTRIELVICVDDITSPVHRVVTHSGSVSQNSAEYREARELAETWSTMLSILMHRAEEEQSVLPQPSQHLPLPSASSVADELRKLLDLQQAGVLSEEEFAKQKARLLA